MSSSKLPKSKHELREAPEALAKTNIGFVAQALGRSEGAGEPKKLREAPRDEHRAFFAQALGRSEGAGEQKNTCSAGPRERPFRAAGAPFVEALRAGSPAETMNLGHTVHCMGWSLSPARPGE